MAHGGELSVLEQGNCRRRIRYSLQGLAESSVGESLRKFREDLQMLFCRLLGNKQNEEQGDRTAIG